MKEPGIVLMSVAIVAMLAWLDLPPALVGLIIGAIVGALIVSVTLAVTHDRSDK